MMKLTPLAIGLGSFCVLNASAGLIDVNVASFPLWTDTGVNLTGGSVTITYLNGQWSWDGAGNLSDGKGTGFDADSYDYFYQGPGASHGELIAYVGSNPAKGPFYPIGDGPTTLAGKTGELWLGFNDDAQSGATGDNTGSLNVQVSSGVPDGSSTLALLGGSMVLVSLFGRRARK